MLVDECVCFLVIKNDKVLLEQRAMQEITKPLLMNIPGGHIKAGESQLQTLVRELDEELMIKAQSFAFLCSLYNPASKLQLLHYYVITEWSGEITAIEADLVRWYKFSQAPVNTAADKIALSEYLRISDSNMLQGLHG